MNNTELNVRGEYEGKMEAKLKELGAKVDELMAKGESVKGQASVKMEELKRKHAELCKNLHEAKLVSQEAWHEFKPGLDKAWEDIGNAFTELKQASEKAASKLRE